MNRVVLSPCIFTVAPFEALNEHLRASARAPNTRFHFGSYSFHIVFVVIRNDLFSLMSVQSATRSSECVLNEYNIVHAVLYLCSHTTLAAQTHREHAICNFVCEPRRHGSCKYKLCFWIPYLRNASSSWSTQYACEMLWARNLQHTNVS